MIEWCMGTEKKGKGRTCVDGSVGPLFDVGTGVVVGIMKEAWELSMI